MTRCDPSRSIAIHGMIFSNNFGDALLLGIMRNWIEDLLPAAKIVVPFGVNNSHGPAGSNTFGRLMEFLRSSQIVFTGGGYFGLSPNHTVKMRLGLLARYASVGLAAGALGKPYGIFGVGVGPLEGSIDKRLIAQVFEKAAVATVRDRESQQWLHQLGVTNTNLHCTADLALTLDRSDVPPSAANAAKQAIADFPYETKIGLHLSATARASPDYKRVFEGVVEFAGQNPDLGFVVFCDHFNPARPTANSQYSVAMDLVTVLGGQARYVGPFDVWPLVALIAELDGLVTNKLHTGIVAAAFGRLAVSIAKHPKNFRFYEQIGEPELCLGLDRTAEVSVTDFLSGCFERLPQGITVPRDVTDSARRNRALLSNFLQQQTL